MSAYRDVVCRRYPARYQAIQYLFHYTRYPTMGIGILQAKTLCNPFHFISGHKTESNSMILRYPDQVMKSNVM